MLSAAETAPSGAIPLRGATQPTWKFFNAESLAGGTRGETSRYLNPCVARAPPTLPAQKHLMSVFR